MSTLEAKREVIRLIDQVDASKMENLLAYIQAFVEQQNAQPFQDDTDELNQLLKESLSQAQLGELISNEEIIKETKEWLTKLSGRPPQGKTIQH